MLGALRSFFSSPPTIMKNGNASFIEVYFLGIALVIVGHSVFWSLGYLLGFWEFFTSTMIVSTAFLILCSCLSEMTGILPFSGGAYGFARVTTGPYWGFIVGFFDSVTNIIYVTLYVRSIVDFFMQSFSLTTEYRLFPLWWFLVYVGMYVLHLVLNKYSFKFISLFGFICLMIPIIYIFGTAHLQDFNEYVTQQEEISHHIKFEGGIKEFMGIIPFSCILYFGVDMICLACEDTKDAIKVVPKVIMAVYITLFVLGFILMFCVAAQPPGILFARFQILPLNIGLATIFKTTSEYATIHVLPAYFVINYSIMYVYGRQMCALARSALLPKVFTWTTSVGNVPYTSLALGNFLGYMIIIWQWFGTSSKQEFDETGKDLFYTAQMGSITVYIISMISFIVFRYKYSTLQRHFINYGGIPSALLGMVIYAFIWVALGFYQYNYFPIKCFTGLYGFATVYYFVYARYTQHFSQEEESILLTVYVIKANSRNRTVYNWLEKRFKKFIDRVDPHGVVFRVSTSKKTGSSGQGGSKSPEKRSDCVVISRPQETVDNGSTPAANEQKVDGYYVDGLVIADPSALFLDKSDKGSEVVASELDEIVQSQVKEKLNRANLYASSGGASASVVPVNVPNIEEPNSVSIIKLEKS